MAAERSIPPVGSPRFSRRLGLAAGVSGLSAWLLASCSDSEKSATDAQPSSGSAPSANVAPKRGGVLRAGWAGDAYPAGAPLTLPSYYLNYAVLEQLIRYRNDLKPELVLVDEFEYSAENTRLVAR